MNFFRFNCEDKKDTLYIKLSEDYDYFELATGGVSFENVIQASVYKGKKEFDFILLSDGLNIAISKKVFSLMEENGITGLKYYPIEIVGSNEEYYGVQIVGRSGSIKETEKGFRTGYDFDYKTWDKSDFFSPQGSSYKFCSERVMKLMIDKKISNVEFVNIKEVKRFV